MIDLPEKYKYSLTALRDCSLSEDLALPKELIKGAWILDKPPFVLSELWRSKLGEFEGENFLKSNFFIFFFIESESLEVRNKENLLLDRMMWCMFDVLMLKGIPSFSWDIKISGYFNKGHQIIWNISKTNPMPSYLREDLINNESLIGLWELSKNLNDIRSDSEDRNYFRIKRGYDSLIRGMGEKFPDQRLHKFVRSIEAFLKVQEGRGKRDFVHRGCLLIGVNNNNRKILDEMYELRSAAEHMNEYNNVLAEYAEDKREEIAFLRCYQAEKFSCQLYLKLASQEKLKEIIRDNHKLEDFWKKNDDEILNIWGEPIELPET